MESELEFQNRVIGDIKEKCKEWCEGFIFEYNKHNELIFYHPLKISKTHCVLDSTAFIDEYYKHDMENVIFRFKNYSKTGSFLR